jgi:hypothetical protein
MNSLSEWQPDVGTGRLPLAAHLLRLVGYTSILVVPLKFK